VLRVVDTHLLACPSCQRLRDVLVELPRWYATIGWLRADRAFKHEVLRRTLGPEPSFWDVVRALWRRPDAVWEAAVACALVTVLLFGSSLQKLGFNSDGSGAPPMNGVTERAAFHRVGEAVVRSIDDGTTHAESVALAPYRVISGAVARMRGFSAGTSQWMERVGGELRTGDWGGLLADLRLVLEPLGLYPEPGAGPGAEQPRTDPGAEQRDDPGLRDPGFDNAAEEQTR
jgi:hypothetical protein